MGVRSPLHNNRHGLHQSPVRVRLRLSGGGRDGPPQHVPDAEGWRSKEEIRSSVSSNVQRQAARVQLLSESSPEPHRASPALPRPPYPRRPSLPHIRSNPKGRLPGFAISKLAGEVPLL